MTENTGQFETQPLTFSSNEEYVEFLNRVAVEGDPREKFDADGHRLGACDLCGVDHDDALSCDEAAAEFAAEKRAGVV